MAARPDADPLDDLAPGERAFLLDLLALFVADAMAAVAPTAASVGAELATVEGRPEEAA